MNARPLPLAALAMLLLSVAPIAAETPAPAADCTRDGVKDLARAMNRNPGLHVLVQQGWHNLASFIRDTDRVSR